MSFSGTLDAWHTRMYRLKRCSPPPMMDAEVAGVGKGRLFGKTAISKAILEGIADSFSKKPFFRTYFLTALPAVLGLGPFFADVSVPKGGGFLDRAAFQSNGVDEEIEGVDAGER